MNALAILIAVIVIVIGFGALLKKNISDKLKRALETKDYESYREIIYSKKASFLLNGNHVALLKSMDMIASGNVIEAKKLLPIIRLEHLNISQKITYYQCCNAIAMSEKDEELFKRIHRELKQLEGGDFQEYIDAMLRENEINQNLYCRFDPKVIDILKEMAEKNEGVNQGMILMSLAKAYYLNKEQDLAKKTLLRAKQLLKGEPQEKIIEKTLADLSVLANGS